MKAHLGFAASAAIILLTVIVAPAQTPFALPATIIGLAIAAAARWRGRGDFALLAIAGLAAIGLAGVTVERIATPDGFLTALVPSVAAIIMIDASLVQIQGGAGAAFGKAWVVAAMWAGVAVGVTVLLHAWDLTAGYLRGPQALEVGIMGAAIACAVVLAFVGVDEETRDV